MSITKSGDLSHNINFPDSPLDGQPYTYEGITYIWNEPEGVWTSDGGEGQAGQEGPQGEKGPKGDPFEYEDFTPEQLEGLKGPQGGKGDQGQKGDDFDYDDFTPEQLEGLKGKDGKDGIDGDDFTYDDFTQEQLEGLKGEQGETGAGIQIVGSLDPGEDPNTAAPKYDDLLTPTGNALIDPDDGFLWVSDGEVWVNTGSIQGPAGSEGEKGPKGDDFKYEDFTPEQLEGLKGDKGDKGNDGDDFTYEDFTQEQKEALKGDKGDQGDKGDDGDDGDDFTYDDFTQEQLEGLKGPQGEQGAGIQIVGSLDPGEDPNTASPKYDSLLLPTGNALIDPDNGHLWVSDGTNWTDMGAIQGPKGDDGGKGPKGDDFDYEDFTPEQLAGLKGDKGDKGNDGDAFTYEDFTPEQLAGLNADSVKKAGDTMSGDLSIDADLSVTGTSTLPAIEQVDNININAGTVKWITGAGEPEGIVSASTGSIYANTSAAPGGGTLFIKTSGDGNIGWEEAGAGVAPPIEPGDGTNALFTETFEGDGINNTVTLNNEPASINNTQVYVSGVYQLKSTYSLAGKVITFTEIPPDGRSIEVVIASSVTFEDSEFVNQSGDTMTGALKIEDNLEVTGETNTGTLVVGDGVAIDAILDEDDMVSDSDTAVPTQQSVKKYVDEKETGGMFKGNDGTKGSGINDIFRVNAQTLTTNVTIDTDQNASAAGPLAIADTVVLTVSGNLTVV